MDVYVFLCPRGAMQCDCSHGMGCVRAPIPGASPTQQKGLKRLTPLSDLCLVLHRAPQALPLLASVCANPLGKILSGLVYEKAVGDTYVMYTSERVQYRPNNTVKPPG